MQGIEFTEHSARAIRAGRKFQTRRVIRELAGVTEHLYFYPPDDFAPEPWRSTWHAWTNSVPKAYLTDADYARMTRFRSRYGVPGDLAFVREPWKRDAFGVRFKADQPPEVASATGGWRPGRFLRADDADLFIEIVAIKGERLTRISAADAIAEGIELPGRADVLWTAGDRDQQAIESFAAHWNQLHSHDGFDWNADPYVLAYTFQIWNADAAKNTT